MSFVYHEPDSLAEATALLMEYGSDALPLAGGTAFSVLMKRGLLLQGNVVGLRRLPELRGIKDGDSNIWIGASTVYREVETSTTVQRSHLTLSSTYGSVATVRIRNQATVGGGLAFGDPAQDPPTSLVALGASIEIAGPDRRRTVEAEGFFVDYFTTSLEVGELVVGVSVPKSFTTRSTYVKFLPRTLDDYATVAVAVALGVDEAGLIDKPRIVVGGVGPTPMRGTSVEIAIQGSAPKDSDLIEAARLIAHDIDPIDDLRGTAEYKREMAAVFVHRALREVLAA